MALAGAESIRDFNVRYHDIAAAEYDSKWSIRYDGESRARVSEKLRLALGGPPTTFPRALEVGAGTGYFGLNLLAAGVVGELVASDISQGMLDRLEASARRLGLPVETRRAEAAALPFPDGSFDLVLGHAVLHHLPDLEGAFEEFHRVLRPGGAIVFCGEPSRHGDRLAAVPKRVALAAAPLWRLLVRAPERRNGHGDEPCNGHAGGAGTDGLTEQQLEWMVDVHSFSPGELRRLAERAGLERVRVRGEELTSSWFGWVSRTLEGSAEPDEVPALWRWYAYGGYLALRQLDRRVLEPHLPPAVFYNLLLSARRA